MTCSDSDRGYSISIIIMLIGILFFTILFLYVVRFGYKGAPTLLENVLVIVVPTIMIILFINRKTTYRESTGKIPCKQEHTTPEDGYCITYRNFSCKICKKHPVSQKYHLKEVHNLINVKLNDYFFNCGCIICIKRIDISGE